MSKRKPRNAKEALERLSKHYGLNKNDFYELHGNWILKHSAVQKMATMPSSSRRQSGESHLNKLHNT